jgi:hypothetical protein
MNIYLSHARKDSDLALKLAKRLADAGLTVLHPEADGTSDENWAMKIGKALKKSDFMVFLLTPGAFEGDWLRMDLEYALGSKKYEGHVFSVFVGPSQQASKEIPWILRSLPHRSVKAPKNLDEVAEEIASQCNAAETSSSHA